MNERQDLVAELRELRLGQLIENVYGHTRRTGRAACFFFTDDVEVIKTMLAVALADKLEGVGHDD